MKQPSININSNGIYDLSGDLLGESLKRDVLNCILAQKEAARTNMEISSSQPEVLQLVSEEALSKAIAVGSDIHGISSQSSISNVITFGARHIENAVHNDEVTAKRKIVDKHMGHFLKSLFVSKKPLKVISSGHFWYPKDSYMGWHTNSRAPGWRIYINYAEEPGKSFFRYRDPISGKIHTLDDETWNIRVFKVTDKDPFWHCVYSETNRFSIGYMIIQEPSLLEKVINKLRRKFIEYR